LETNKQKGRDEKSIEEGPTSEGLREVNEKKGGLAASIQGTRSKRRGSAKKKRMKKKKKKKKQNALGTGTSGAKKGGRLTTERGTGKTGLRRIERKVRGKNSGPAIGRQKTGRGDPKANRTNQQRKSKTDKGNGKRGGIKITGH